MGARARARESSGAQLLIIKPSFPSLLPLAAPLLSRGPRPRPRPARSPKAMWGKRTPLIALSKTPRFSSPPVSGARCASDCLLMLVPLPAHVRSGARTQELRCRGRRRRGRQEFRAEPCKLSARHPRCRLQPVNSKRPPACRPAGLPARPEA